MAVGKYQTKYEKIDDFTLISSIEKIITQSLYQGISGNYGSDISLLVLKETIVFSQLIKPICIDWQADYVEDQLKPGNIGYVIFQFFCLNNIY